MPRARLAAVLLALACLYLSACAGKDVRADYEKFKLENDVQPFTEPVDLVYRPVSMGQTMTFEAHYRTRSVKAVYKTEHETRALDDGSGGMSWIDRILSIGDDTESLRTDEPLIVLDIQMTPKGEVIRQELMLPGLTHLGYDKDSDQGEKKISVVERHFGVMRLPDVPVANGDVVCTLPWRTIFFNSMYRHASGPEVLSLKVDGQGMMNGRPILTASGQMECSLLYEGSGLLPYSARVYSYRIYDLSTMGLVSAGMHTEIERRGQTLYYVMTMTAETIR